MKKYTAAVLFLVHVLVAGQTIGNNKKTMIVKEIKVEGAFDLQNVSRLLEEKIELQTINLINWEAFSYRPEVKFRIAHSNNQIWLKFYVKEENVLAQRTETNSATHKDSCVEFFIDPGQEGKYYNFEFNCIGITHLAYGPGRGKREFIDPKTIQEQIMIESTLGNQPFDEKKGGHSWEMTIVIPASIFTHTNGLKLKGMTSNANFYKCGDDTSKPHYLSWSPVGTEQPDFHQPDFFGGLSFE